MRARSASRAWPWRGGRSPRRCWRRQANKLPVACAEAGRVAPTRPLRPGRRDRTIAMRGAPPRPECRRFRRTRRAASSATGTDVSTTPQTPTSSRNRAGLWLLVMLLLAGAAGWVAWRQWQVHEAALAADARSQVDALSQRVDTVRGEQRSHSRRLQQAESLNRVLRDELDGIGQRAALLEESVEKLSDPDRHGAQALRLDEAELLLTLGAQRLEVAGDLDGARRAYALADGVLGGIDDPAYLSLRQALQQERAALDALGADPRVRAIAQLEAFAREITAPADTARSPAPVHAPWWQRAFGNLLRVEATDRAVAVQPADRAAALAGLQLEISLAR